MPNDKKHKHLEMIQNVIDRMSSNSFLIKAWSITIISSLYTLWFTQKDNFFLFLILTITLFFWGYDAYYLYVERGFRNLYDEVRKKSESEIDYEMTPYYKDKLVCVALRPILFCSYGILTIITLLLIYICK